MLLYVCSVIDHRCRQDVMKIKKKGSRSDSQECHTQHDFLARFWRPLWSVTEEITERDTLVNQRKNHIIQRLQYLTISKTNKTKILVFAMLKKRVDLLSDLNSNTAYLQCKQMWCVLYFKNCKTKKEIKHADAIKY